MVPIFTEDTICIYPILGHVDTQLGYGRKREMGRWLGSFGTWGKGEESGSRKQKVEIRTEKTEVSGQTAEANKAEG